MLCKVFLPAPKTAFVFGIRRLKQVFCLKTDILSLENLPFLWLNNRFLPAHICLTIHSVGCKGDAENPASNGFNRVGTHHIYLVLPMKKEIVKKKLVFKKTLVANMDNSAANQILGGGGTTYSDTPCVCWSRACPPESSYGSFTDHNGCDCNL
jgi:hypothetical protein